MSIGHELSARITQYLEAGGLFNPEMMEHEKVRALLMDCREALELSEDQQIGWFHPVSRRFCYTDELKKHREGGYAIPVYAHYPDDNLRG